MCGQIMRGQTMTGPQPVTSSGQALSALDAGLSWLATTDMVALTTDEQADCLRALERAESQLTAARASVLSAFDTASGYETDACRGSKSWLRWQTRVTGGTATAAVGWMRRLRAHPAVTGVLAEGDISASWARQLCDWSDSLPDYARADADQIMLAAAADGCELADIGRLAEEMYRRCARPDTDPEDDGFVGRNVRLATHFRGHGKLDGDLTPECNAALQAVLDALGQRAGPEDLRTPDQLRHDALQEACRRAIAAGDLPDRAGQPTQIQLHMTLEQLLGLDGAADAIAGWPAARPGWDCDASISPIVTGTLDADLLDRLAGELLARAGQDAQADTGHWSDTDTDTDTDTNTNTNTNTQADSGTQADSDQLEPHGDSPLGVPGDSATGDSAPEVSAPEVSDGYGGESAYGAAGHDRAGQLEAGQGESGQNGSGQKESGQSDAEQGGTSGCNGDACRVGACRGRARSAASQLVISRATRLLCGPSGLAAYLRTQLLPQPAASMSLPLDVGKPTEVIPPHLRRAIIARDRHCAFPGCDQPPVGCHVHHLIPRSQGGTTSLDNCYLLCTFHHLIAVHIWGWKLSPNPDGTLTASSPYRSYTSHGPPASAA